jgi:probable F420-dependent oxidoreductase
VKIGIAGANVASFEDREAALALARVAEDAGVESLWAFEHVVVPAGYRSRYPYSASGRMPGDGMVAITDPLGWLSFLAAATERIGLGTGILILPEHNPVVLAKLTATIDRLSRGRLLLGVGVGWLREEFEALGVPWEGRTARTLEYIEVVRRLWTQEEATFHGRFVHLDRARCVPKPWRPTGVPIIVGGHSEAAARRAGALGDGFFPAAPPDRLRQLLPVMRRSADEAGRDPTTIEVTAQGGPNADLDLVRRLEDLGVSRVLVSLPTYDPANLARAFGELHERLLSRVGAW